MGAEIMRDMPVCEFTLEQLAQFHLDGFYGPIDLYDPDEMDQLWSEVRRRLPDRSRAIYPSNSFGSVTNISNYDRHFDVEFLAHHVCNPRIVGKLVSILGPDVMCWRTEFFPKYPGDEGTDWHQADTFANASGKPQILWPGESAAAFGKGTITVWTAFTDATLENGCLQLMPGTHRSMNYDESLAMEYRPEVVNKVDKSGSKRGFFGYDYRDLQVDPDWRPDETKACPMVMKRGQCLIFWSTLMHASLPNTATHYRMGFAARYVPSYVRVYPNTDVVEEYGGRIPLDDYGAVVVAGEMREACNRVALTDRHGVPFVKYPESLDVMAKSVTG